MPKLHESRYEKGKKVLDKMNPVNAAKLEEKLKDICPDLSRFVFEFAYGDIYSRPELDRKSREIATLAALTTLGTAPRELRSHIMGALRSGCSRQEIVEVVLQMAVYAGFPAAINAMEVVKNTFQELDASASENKNEPINNS